MLPQSLVWRMSLAISKRKSTIFNENPLVLVLQAVAMIGEVWMQAGVQEI
jgi:hypothetical protein